MVEPTVVLSLLKVTIAAAVGLLALRLSRRRAASVRHAMLVATFVALAAIPVVAIVAPPRVVTFEHADWLGVAEFAEAPPMRSGVAGQARGLRQPSTGRRWATPLFAAWASGMGLCLLAPLGAFLQTRRLRRDGRPSAARLDADRPIGCRNPARIRVLHHPDVTGPMTCGVARPVILLPDDAGEWERRDLDRALAHEAAHIGRGDFLVHGLARCLCAAYWFHPLVWICWRRLREEAERACDDVVLTAFEGPAAYARQLVDLARRQSPRPPLSAMTAMARRGELASRIQAILDDSQPRQRLGHRNALAITAVVGMIVAGLGTVRPMRAASSHLGLSFSSASVVRSPTHRPVSMELLPDGQVRITGATLSRLLRLSYGVQDHAIVGAPAWMDADHVDISATFPPGSTSVAVQQMLRALLAERFALQVEYQVQERPVFVMARRQASGALLRPSRGCDSASSLVADGRTAPREPCGFRVGHGRIEGVGVTLDAVAATLSRPLGRPVLVDTGGAGSFDFVLSWDPGDRDSVEVLTAAVRAQLGLTLVEQVRAVPVVVVRSARPLA